MELAYYEKENMCKQACRYDKKFFQSSYNLQELSCQTVSWRWDVFFRVSYLVYDLCDKGPRDGDPDQTNTATHFC